VSAILERLLNDPDAGLIEEWAILARRRGVRVMDATVPALVDWWARQPRRSDAVFAVTGERGRWLASLNAEWRKPVVVAQVPANAEELWQTGTGPERAALLTGMRRHDPARGLALVMSTWSADGADERRRFVEALSEGRSMADEPFLETALDDRSKTVRRAAAGALARIPGSRLKARLTALARTIISVERRKGLLRRESVKISLSKPADYDAAWERDGVEEQPPGGVGKRAWWTTQILAGCEIAVWSEASGLDPAGVVAAIDTDDLKDSLEALGLSAVACGDIRWAAPLTDTVLKSDPKHVSSLRSLWDLMPAPERESLMTRVVQTAAIPLPERLGLLGEVGHAWSEGFSEEILQQLAKQAGRKPDAWTLSPPLDGIVRAISPKALDVFEQTLAAIFSDESINTVQKITDRLRLRAEMHKEFHK
jgi:hypothetical protein